MTGIVESVTVGGEFLTVSLIVWRRFRRPMPGLVEAIHDMNPGLASLGPILPMGAAVYLPDTAPAAPQTLHQLWD